ncbi:MAG: tetratricopeptide repeat protein [Gammaproteobacteria bacterium]
MPTKKLLSSIFVFCLLASIPALADELLDRAQQLIDDKKAGQAYELLNRDYEQRAGDPEFDLLLGIAALDSGHPTQAVFAFERVLTVEPDNARARAELARAYFEMGENEAAREEFTAVREQSVPESVSRSIEQYLSEIDARAMAATRRIDVFIEAAAGYDSNANSATDVSTIAIPAFGNLLFTLDDTGQEQDSGFFSLAAGTRFGALLNDAETLRLFGGADIHERITVNATDFRTRMANGRLGLRYNRGMNAFQGSVIAQRYYIGGEENRDLAGVNLQYLRNYGNRTQLSAYGRFAVHRFPNQRVRNVNEISGGLGLVHLFRTGGDPVLFASVFAGEENEQRDSRPDIGKTFYGVRLGGQYNLNRRTKLVGNLSYQYNRYGGNDPLFQTRRKDHFVFARAGVEYELDGNWMVRPEIQFTHNDSTLGINEFDRWQPFVTIRNQF